MSKHDFPPEEFASRRSAPVPDPHEPGSALGSATVPDLESMPAARRYSVKIVEVDP